MSADTVYQQLRSRLAYLKLTAAADALAPALEAAERDKPGYTQFLADLLAVEVQATEQRRLEGRLRFAKLPARKTLEQFDFDAQPSLDRRLVDDLATLRFVEERANVLLIGPPGVGKRHLAIALGHRAVHAGYRVYYTTAADLVARTSRAALEGRWATTSAPPGRCRRATARPRRHQPPSSAAPHRRRRTAGRSRRSSPTALPPPPRPWPRRPPATPRRWRRSRARRGRAGGSAARRRGRGRHRG